MPERLLSILVSAWTHRIWAVYRNSPVISSSELILIQMFNNYNLQTSLYILLYKENEKDLLLSHTEKYS